jgi:RHO1 GDP-GTP exchange protein 1/2
VIVVALHEPYVLAFEPTFVEIRHIESGLLSQVIQGSNLRLLFADTPPTIVNNNTMHQHPQHQGYEYQPYVSHPHSSGSHGSFGSMYGGGYAQYPSLPNPHANLHPPHPPAQYYTTQHPVPPPIPATSQSMGRDEILIVSDDRVLSLRTVVGTQRHISDTASMVSLPR